MQWKWFKDIRIGTWNINVRSKDQEDWKRLVEEAKVHIGL